MSKFGFLDYAVIGAYLAAMVILALKFSKRQTSLKEYFQASGKIPWWAAGISIFATALSPISYLASPGWIFSKDTRNSLFSAFLGFGVIFLAAAVWIPLWSRLRVTSIYEYLERRYHPAVRMVGSFLFLLGTVFWLGTALVTAAKGFEAVTGIDGRYCLAFIAVLSTAYTTIGGMRAVIWTDVAQFIIFMVGYAAIALIILAVFNWEPTEVYRVASSTVSEKTGYPHTKLISAEFSLAIEATIWAIVFSRLMGVVGYGASQMAVQRMHAAGSRRNMFKAMIGGQVCSLLFTFIAIPVTWGLIAFYQKYPELAANAISHPDQVLPTFVVQRLPAIIRSFLMAGVLAALMSSFDSAINSMSGVVISDFYHRYAAPRASEKHLVLVSKILTLTLGLALLLFALWQYNHSKVTALEVLGKLGNLIASPVVSFFILGIISKRTNTPGVLIGAGAGVGFALVFNGFSDVIPPLIRGVNWMWVGGLATLVNLVVGYVASLCFGPPPPGALTDLTVLEKSE